MITIVDLEAVNRYRERRENRIARADEGWITVNGTHILVGDDDEVLLGPDELKKPDLKVGKEMKPINSDYDYEDGDDEEDFTRKNIDKLKKIYDESGINAVHDEWYKFRMENSTNGLHQISKDDADEVMYDNVRQSIYDGWFRNADSSYKPKLVDAVIGSPEVRNAALNLAYENYKEVGKMEGKKPLSFEEFLTTPIKMYRGENGQRHLEDDVFDAYTFDRKMAEHFANKPGRGESKVIEVEVRPIDTYGSMRVVGESEIWVPRELSPVGYKHGDRMDESHRYNPVLWAFEDYEEPVDDSVDILDSIIRDAEMVKLFADNGEETGKKILARCFDGIQKSVLQLTARKVKDTNNDSAFFEGELNSNLGEREVLYPEIKAFQERRKKRMDEKEPEDWITVNGNHIPVDKEGKPVGGQKKALGEIVKSAKTGSTVGEAKVASRIGFKKSPLDVERIKELNSRFESLAERMTEANRRVKEEEKKLNEKWKGVPYKRRPYSAWDDLHKEMAVQKEIASEFSDAFSGLPVGTLLNKNGVLYEKADGGWLVRDARKDWGDGKPISEKTAFAGVDGKDSLSAVKPVRCIETTDDAEMVRPIEVKSDETYKSFADVINAGDKKAVVARAKKDPEFKELVDGITLYTQGAYGDQKREAAYLVKNGTREALAETAGDYFSDTIYDMKQLWSGQHLAESNSSFSGGVLSMMGAINNAEPYKKPLWRVADDRNVLMGSSDMGALYVPPKVGDKVKMDTPTSFTKNRDALKDIGKAKYGDIITYELEPGARALDISHLSHYKSQEEALTCGEFEVVDVNVTNPRGATRLVSKDAKPEVVETAKKRSVGVDEDGNYIVPYYVVSIKLRQVGKTDVGKRDDGYSACFDCRNHFDGRMVLPDDVLAFRERRRKRLDAKEDDLEWITVNGAHIPIDDDGDLKGKAGNEIERHVAEAKESSAESMGSEPVSKSRVNKKLNEIADSDMSDDEKVKAIKSEFPGLRPGTKIIMPESWNDDDGKPQIYTYDGMFWNDDRGWGSLSEEDMAYYFLDKDPNERPKIKSIPRDPESVEASRKKREESKSYAMNPDGSINGKYTKDFHNGHVSQEERDSFSKEIKEMVDYEKGWDSGRSLYRGEANRVGEKIVDEIKRRVALRKGDKENAPINGQPQVEDIYDVLRDMREFGMPDGFEPTINSDLPKERTDAIIKEAFDRFPTDWFREADSKPIINIINGPGRAICINNGYINVYTQKDLGLSSGELTTLNDRAIVNDLAHELGHYIEWTNKKVQYSARDCLWERGKDSEIIEVEPGYNGYKDSFFNPYMGKIYSHGGTEIISMLMGNIGCFQPFSVLEGHEYDYGKGKYDGRKKRDKESLGYALGVLAGL